MNIVLLNGNLGKDAVPINGGIKFSLATSDNNGKEDVTLWTDILVYGTKAEKLAPFLVKGKSVIVRGKLRPDVDAEGNHRKSIVLASDIELC